MSTTLHLVLGVGTTLALVALGACVLRARPLTSAGPHESENAAMTTSATTNTTTTTADDAADAPPLDVAARHVRHQTATFALG